MLKIIRLFILTFAIGYLFPSCKSNDEVHPITLFEKLPSDKTGITFRNDLTFDKTFNIFTYRNFYNGGGVAIGDINNDGLPDIYLTSNLGENKLYLNKGDFQFEDITDKAGVAGTRAWSTGVAMADVNGDGWLDIYVCNSGDVKGDNKQNELFINNGDGTFSEVAEAYGLADQGFSTHAVFFDYDNDGDLDVYLLNNSYKAIGSFNLMQNIRPVRDEVGGDKLFRNDGDTFTDVSEEAGIYGSLIGFGLGVTVGDVNNDGWMDIFISNDFFERDYLYINNQNGTFSEVLEKSMPSISAASMGADMADINNDGWMDIFVTDMLPEDDKRLKQVTTFENYDKFTYNFAHGYHYQLTRNMLHMNNGNGTFSDISRLAGVEATDWSWAALIFDMDNDGYKDVFIANGIYKDITDLDYLNFIDDPQVKRKIITKDGVDYEALIDPIPVNPVPNYAFHNQGNLRFKNKANLWGVGEPLHSNGAAYADLNNDGSLDLVVNNVNNEVHIYRNRIHEINKENRYLKFKLQGEDKNLWAIGARVEVKAGGEIFTIEQMPNRGFQSSVDPVLHLGLGDLKHVEQIKVRWPNQKITLLENVETNQILELKQAEFTHDDEVHFALSNFIFNDFTDKGAIKYKHIENSFVDFDRDRLTYHMLSTQGPALAVGDVNGDGLEDVYIGGAKGQAGQIFIQQKSGNFSTVKSSVIEADATSEDVQAIFIDVDNDGDLDLFVASGGNEFSVSAPELRDRLYINDGKGNFSKSDQTVFNVLRNITGAVAAADFDGDGFVDLFVGSRAVPFYYGVPANGHILRNDGKGNFTDVTLEIATDLKELGLMSSAVWSDYDSDGDLDLIVLGEWMAIEVFENQEGNFKRVTVDVGLVQYNGWWNVIVEADVNNDGKPDYILGNHGLNSRFKTNEEQRIVLYVNDFDNNGTIDHIYGKQRGNEVYPFLLKHDLVMQIPSLKKEYLRFENYNNKYLSQIFSPAQLEKSIKHEARYMQSAVLLNQGDGKFEFIELPIEAQFAPVYAIHVSDMDGDGLVDIVLGGNLYEVKPEAGRYDASYGLYLKNIGAGNFKAVPARTSGLNIKGAIRQIKAIETASGKYLLVALNNDELRLIKVNN
jgi:enediyne biosynthesis protein E4